MNVLIAIHHRVTAWEISPAHVDALRTRFPRDTFLHAADRDADLALAPEADVAFALSLSKDAIARAARLRWLHASGHAVSHFPLADLAARNVIVTNSRGVQGVPIAEHVMGCLLALARRLPDTLRMQREHTWRPNELRDAGAPWLVSGKTIGIIGMGTLGQTIAARAKAFGMTVIGMRRDPSRDRPPHVDQVVGPADRDRLLTVADVVVLAAPSTAETERILDAEAIARLKPHAIVVNIARGSLLDEAALSAALTAGKLGGAILDVFETEPLAPESPLWDLPNVILTPHSSGFRQGHFDAVIDLFSENLQRYERGEPLLNLVNLETGY
jgi:phosphoglycerate dehydrogenase-like enzyme